MIKTCTSMLTAFFLFAFATVNGAELKLAEVFSDHMVLQREKPVPVWGWANAGDQVVVSFNSQSKECTANAEGLWMVRLDALQTNAQPSELVVHLKENKAHAIRVTDVLVGEVWLGSGQSNMAMAMNGVNDAEGEKAAANWPLLRMFKEESPAAKTPQAHASGSWKVCTPQNVSTFSATLYCFGRDLHKELNLPIGLINSSVGGTPIESWISLEAQSKAPELSAAVESELQVVNAFDETKAKAAYEKQLAQWKERAAKAKANGQSVPAQPRDPIVQFKRRGGPGGLFNGKIHPLIPFAVRGVVWYQGESGANSAKSHLYQYQLPTLVNDWRARWMDELPFAWVQLPNYGGSEEGWPVVREAMLKTLKLPKTGMAITIDIGELKNIHPKNKQDVGKRLALWALGDVYHHQVPATSGPLPLDFKINGREIAVRFKHSNGGLKAKDDSELKGFMIAGADQTWHAAQAKIVGDQVIVSHDQVKDPTAVRYAWAADPVCNLVNGAGLPASPFRLPMP